MKYDTIQQQMQAAARVSDMELHQLAEKFTKDIREMKTKKIEHYPNELHIEADNGEHYTINYEGLQGELTREEWKDDEIVSKFDQESKDEILRALDMAYNGEFFKNSRKND